MVAKGGYTLLMRLIIAFARTAAAYLLLLPACIMADLAKALLYVADALAHAACKIKGEPKC